MESLLLTFGILLNILQFFQIGIFIRFIVCEHFNMKTFLLLYSFFSILELSMIGYMMYWVHKKKQIETENEEIIILTSCGTYLFIKFLLILFESFLSKKMKKNKKLNTYFHCMKFLKTFTTMNTFVTALLNKEQIEERPKKIGIMIGIPLLLYLFFLGLNQLIIFLRKRNNIGYRILENNSNQQNKSIKPYQKQRRISQNTSAKPNQNYILNR